MSQISRERLVSLTEEFVSHETVFPPNGEQPLAEAIYDYLTASELDFDIELEEVDEGRPNVIARIGNPEHGTLLFTGHMDVVPATASNWSGDPFSLRRTEEKLIGRGTADMKASLAAMIVATEAYVASTTDPGEIILAFVVDEEGDQIGTKALVANGIDADAAVIGEPTELQIAIAEFGFIGYTVSVHGQSAHSGRPDKGINAITGLRKLLAKVDKLDKEIRAQEHQLFNPSGSISVTEISGGTAKNVIPDYASATITWRTLPTDRMTSPEEYDRMLLDVLEGTRLNNNPIDFELERFQFFPAIEIDADTPIVTAMLEATDRLGVKADLTGFHAGSDAVYLINDAAIPTILFGPGSISEDAHTVDESITVDDLKTTAQIYQSLLEYYFAGPP